MKKLITLILSITFCHNIFAQKYTNKYIEEANKIGLEWWHEVNTGDYEKAYIFIEIYYSTVDKDLIAADNFVNEYRDRVKDMSFDEANLKLRRGKKTGNLYGEIRNPTVSEYLKDFME